MIGHSNNSISSYNEARKSIEHSPHRVISLLLSGFMERIKRAKVSMENKDVKGKVDCLLNCVEIVDGLRLSLDLEKGGDLAANLDALYEYVSFRLVEANMSNDPVILDEITGLIGKIESAWLEIGDAVQGGQYGNA